jgi:hypothetical protein
MPYLEDLLAAYAAGLADKAAAPVDDARAALAMASNAHARGLALADIAWALVRARDISCSSLSTVTPATAERQSQATRPL